MQELKSNWGLLLAATICSSLVGVHYHFLGSMVKPLGAAYGWGRGQTSLALTIASITLPFTAIAVGWLGDRFGARRVVLPGIILYGISFSMLGLAGPSLLSWYLLFAFFALVGFGGGIVLWSKAIVQCFDKSRGLALAVSASGVGVLVAIIPTAVLFCLHNFGVRGTFPAWGLAATSIMFPIAWIFCPHGATRNGIVPAERAPARGASWEILRLRAFWLLIAAILAIGWCNGPFVVQMQSILTDSGLTPQQAARAALVIGPGLIVARVGVGLLFDHLPARMVASACFLAPAVASACISQLNGSFGAAIPGILVAAVALGAEVDVAGYLTSRYIPEMHYGFAYGAVIGVYGLGLSLGSTSAGYIHDWTGSHIYALLMIGGMSLVAMCLALMLGPIPRQAPRKLA